MTTHPTGDLAADLAAAGLTVTPRTDGSLAVDLPAVDEKALADALRAAGVTVTAHEGDGDTWADVHIVHPADGQPIAVSWRTYGWELAALDPDSGEQVMRYDVGVPHGADIATAVRHLTAWLKPATPAKPHPYHRVANALEVLAERCRLLALAPEATELREPTTFAVYVFPADVCLPRPGNAAVAETVAAALLPDVPVEVKTDHSRTEAVAQAHIGPVRVQIAAAVPEPPDPRDTEIAALRAELAARDAGTEGDR